MKNEQKNAFLEYEADEWFCRNRKYIEAYDSSEDEVIKLIKSYDLKAKSILELGCSAGYRLNALKEIYSNANVSGLEPSRSAIDFGQRNYPRVNFVNGTADDLSCFKDDSFDLLIVGFILYVIDRNLLIKVISEIDRVLKDGGIIIIIDFFSEVPSKRSYMHIKDVEAFTYKQNYEDILTSTKLYHLLDKSSFCHIQNLKSLSGDYFNKYCVSVLRKDLNASYM